MLCPKNLQRCGPGEGPSESPLVDKGRRKSSLAFAEEANVELWNKDRSIGVAGYLATFRVALHSTLAFYLRSTLPSD